MILTLKFPIVGENQGEILQHTIKGNFVPPGKRIYHQTVPNELETIVMKAMALEKADRYDSVEQFQSDVGAYMRGYAISAERNSIFKQCHLFLKRRKAEACIMAASILVLVVSLFFFLMKLNFHSMQAQKEREYNKMILVESLEARSDAEIQRKLAEQNKFEADKSLLRAELNDYISNLRFSEMCIRQSRYDVARQALRDCPKQFRHWEWRRLKYLTELDLLTIPLASELSPSCLSRNGKFLAAANTPQSIFVRDLVNGELHEIMRESGQGVVAMAISGNGERLVIEGYNNSTELWDVASEKLMQTFIGQNASISSIASNENGNIIALGNQTGQIQIWDANSGKKIRSFKGHRGSVLHLILDRTGESLLSGGSDDKVNFWDLRTGKLLINFRKNKLVGMDYNEQHGLIVAGSTDNSIEIRHMKNGESYRELMVENLTSIAFSGNGKMLITGGKDFSASVWDIDSGNKQFVLNGHSGPILSVALSETAQNASTVSQDRTTKYWSLDQAIEHRYLKGHEDEVMAIAVSPDDKYVATAAKDDVIKIWSVESGIEVFNLQNHPTFGNGLCFSHDGEELLVPDTEFGIKI